MAAVAPKSRQQNHLCLSCNQNQTKATNNAHDGNNDDDDDDNSEAKEAICTETVTTAEHTASNRRLLKYMFGLQWHCKTVRCYGSTVAWFMC